MFRLLVCGLLFPVWARAFHRAFYTCRAADVEPQNLDPVTAAASPTPAVSQSAPGSPQRLQSTALDLTRLLSFSRPRPRGPSRTSDSMACNRAQDCRAEGLISLLCCPTESCLYVLGDVDRAAATSIEAD